MKEFAPQYARHTVKGNDWVDFPRNDREFRLKHFIPESLEHQAKANLYMVEALIEYQSEPGDRILDITAGTGSVLIGALSNRHVSMIEINPELVGYIDKSADKMGVKKGFDPGEYWVWTGACQDYLPLGFPVDAIIFSPPYSTALTGQSGMKQDESLAIRQERHKELYNVGGDKNLNKMENFKYTLEMGTIYRKCFETLKPGGTVGLIIKDRASKGRRVELSMSAVRAMFRAGFTLHSWFKWDPPGQKQYETMHKERGHMWIDEEELIVMQKPFEED